MSSRRTSVSDSLLSSIHPFESLRVSVQPVGSVSSTPLCSMTLLKSPPQKDGSPLPMQHTYAPPRSESGSYADQNSYAPQHIMYSHPPAQAPTQASLVPQYTQYHAVSNRPSSATSNHIPYNGKSSRTAHSNVAVSYTRFSAPAPVAAALSVPHFPRVASSPVIPYIPPTPKFPPMYSGPVIPAYIAESSKDKARSHPKTRRLYNTRYTSTNEVPTPQYKDGSNKSKPPRTRHTSHSSSGWDVPS
ncbi:hypothetical protein CPC08DRAFT_766999 [Agrocybe pediades]|nr:hypothetical protein CPC08DRAFT_766999 [Agrocybe pediades]